MEPETIDRLLELGKPNEIALGDSQFVDKAMHILMPPVVGPVACSTLQGLVDLLAGGINNAKAGPDVLVQIESPFRVAIGERTEDGYGRRQIHAVATYPKECPVFEFGKWLNVENFIIACQQGFQRVKVESDDGIFAQDLDYVIKTASDISADSSVANTDDGIAQRVAVKTGVVLKADMTLKSRVQLAPFRTFAEIDQVLSTFIFRAKQSDGGGVLLALFEGDGGRWRISAVAAIKQWLTGKVGVSPIIS